MGLTFLMVQKDSGNRSVAAKVPYFAEMINERAASFGDEWTSAVGNLAVQRPLPKDPLRGFRDERDDGISGRGRWPIGDLLLADFPDAT
jgi:hypothetical protein